MPHKELTHHERTWLLGTEYKGNEKALEHDLGHDEDYVMELLRFCPPSPSAMPLRQLQHQKHAGFVEAPLSTEPEEDLRLLEKKVVPISQLRSTQWTVFRSVIDHYKIAYKHRARVPPILVVLDKRSGLAVIKDGHHRATAQHELSNEGCTVGTVEVAVSKRSLRPYSNIYRLSEMHIENR